MSERRQLGLQPYYRVAELVVLTDTTRGRVLRMLHFAGVDLRWVGGQRLVFACDLEARMPALWRSLVVVERARAMARALEVRRQSSPRRGRTPT